MNYFRLVKSAFNIAGRLNDAREKDSEGGSEVMPKEAVKIVLELASEYSASDGLVISLVDLKAAAEDVGFIVV